jgi:hypothetical protein
MCVTNKIYLRALPEALPTSIAEVTCERNLPAEFTCPESSRQGATDRIVELAVSVIISENVRRVGIERRWWHFR